jgi:hypothetical protein
MRRISLRTFGFVAGTLSLAVALTIGLGAQQRLPQPPGIIVVPEIRTKIEAALASTNALLVSDYHRVEFRFGPSVRIDAVIVNMGRGQRVRGLRVQVTDETRAGRPDRASYVDIEEVAGLSEALTTMSDLIRSWSNRDDRRTTELSFTSVGGLRIEVRETGRAQRAFLYTGIIEPVVTEVEVGDISALRQAVDQGLALLNAK